MMENTHSIRMSSPTPPALAPLPVEEWRDDCNGHSSPDSGVNDMSTDERSCPGSGAGGGDHLLSPRSAKSAPIPHRITLAADEHLTIKLGDTVRHVAGPASIAMVSNGAHPPIQAPPGHMVQRIMGENGMVTQYILRPQHPNMNPGPMNPGPAGQMANNASGSGHYTYGAANTQGMPMQSGGGHHHGQYSYGAPNGSQPCGYSQNSQQQPYPAGYHPQYHHHLMQPSGGGGGSLHSMVVNGGGGGGPPSTHGADDRIQHRSSSSRHRDKAALLHRHKAPEIILSQRYNQNFHPRVKMNGGGTPTSAERSLDLSSCSSSTDSHDTTDDEKRMLFDKLSAIQPPQVDTESRRAVVRITAPTIPDNLIVLDPSTNTDVQFQLQYTDKKDGPYKVVYEGDATTIKMQDLRPATEYFIRLCAMLDDVTGSFTDAVPFETRAAPPDAPACPKLCSKGKAFIALKWNAATDNGSKILHYILECYQDQQQQQQMPYSECYRGPKKEFKMIKLKPSQRYTYRLSAVNDCGQSEHSKEMVVYTNGSAPPQPDPPHLSEATLNTLLLTWIKRPTDKEFVLQKEEEYTGHGFLATYTGPEVSYRVDCLRRSATYKFRLQAANEDGKSVWSQAVTYRTRADLPSTPTKLSLRGKALCSTFKLVWEVPHEDGGSEVKTYHAQLDGGSGYQAVYDGDMCECSCVNLLPGFTYRARVAARNAVGLGRWSEPTSVTTKPVPPGKCGKPGLAGKPKAHDLHFKWACPENTGGAHIKGYVVQLIMMDNTTREVYRGYGTDCVVAGLSPGRSYLLQVRAVNEAGEGDWSEPLDVISGAGVPESPLAPCCQVKSAHAILLSWQAPCNNGAKISEYRLEWQRPHHQGFSPLFSGPDLHHEVKSLQPNTVYSFRVQAVNMSGVSPPSEHTAATTLPSSPAAMHHVRTAPSATSITVSWEEPDNNGCDITQYNIEYGKNQLIPVTDVSETECVIDNLVPDTLYRIRVQAVNAVGSGVFSAQVKVTTLSLPPAPPTLDCLGSTWNSVRLSWPEADNCDKYTVMMSRNQSTTPQCVYQGVSHQCRVTKLHEQTDYHFTISAVNNAGEGPQCDPITVTTCRAPPHSLKAPVLGEISEDGCEVKWQAAKPFSADSIEYRLQLSPHGSSTSVDYKQVHQGTETVHRLSGLSPGTSYSVRVAAVRICDADVEPVVGAYSPGAIFKTHKLPPIAVPERAAKTLARQSALRSAVEKMVHAVTPSEELQYPIIVLIVMFLMSVLLAGLAHWFVQ